MKTQNMVQLIGYLGDDPIVRTAVNGSKMARIRLATDYFRRDAAGKVCRKVTWHDVIAWDRVAEKVPGNFIKGSHILVLGEIRHRAYKDETGQPRNVTEVRASSLLNLDR